jgi:hypothetical protein
VYKDRSDCGRPPSARALIPRRFCRTAAKSARSVKSGSTETPIVRTQVNAPDRPRMATTGKSRFLHTGTVSPTVRCCHSGRICSVLGMPSFFIPS